MTSMHTPFDTRIYVKECRSLSKKYDVYLVASEVESQEKDHVHVVGVKMPPHGLRKMLTTKPVIKAAESIDADIYHIHDPELMRAGLFFKKKGKKVIFDYHENFKEFLLAKPWIPKLLRGIASRLFGYYESKMLPQYDALISVTPYIIRRLEDYNKQTYLITNYPFKTCVEDKRSWENKVCFIGGIMPEWEIDNVVRALPQTSSRLVLAGDIAPASYFEGMKNLEGWDKVDYLGRIPYSRVIPTMQECTAGLCIRPYDHPNSCYRDGSLGANKFFEYLIAGIPVIASGLTVWKEIIEKYECGVIVEPDNVESIASAINFLINNPSEAKKLGDNGIKAAKEVFNWETQEVMLFELYDTLLNNR